mmetsp:Transcript_29914/g.78850  ORF Transcript_29914/g.78850 Transcript_29914/m.78850 type:complete len:241 (-) Transcript_29914:30-752(-)
MAKSTGTSLNTAGSMAMRSPTSGGKPRRRQQALAASASVPALKSAGATAPPASSSTSGASARSSGLSWEELEDVKLRAASALDRVEYLGRSATLFTELKASEARNLELTMRTRSHSNLHLTRSLDRSRDAAAKLLDDQSELLKSSRTASKRHDLMNRYVFENEEKFSGKLAQERAVNSARGKEPSMTSFPSYQELLKPRLHVGWQMREAPTMAVKCVTPYKVPPPSAMRRQQRSRLAEGT